MQTFLDQIWQTFGNFLPSLVWAIVILVGGWLLALIISAAIGKLLSKTSVDNTLAERLGFKDASAGNAVEQGVSRAVFWIIMLFVLVAFFEALGLTIVTNPLNSLLTQLALFVPNLLGAGVLLLVAWVVATLLRFVVSKGLGMLKLDDRLGQQAGLQAGQQPPLSETVANVIYWFVFLLFLPAVLGALDMQGLLGPVQDMVDTLLGFLPNVLGAAVILLVGWFIARIIRQIVVGLLVAVGVDKLGQRVGLGAAGETQSLSGIVGLVIYALILIPAIVSGLNALQIDAISRPATDMLTSLLAAVPNVFGAMIIIAAAYIIGRLVAGLVTNVLAGVGFNKVLGLIGLGSAEPAEGQVTPSEIVGYLVLIGLLIFAAIQAAEILGFAVVASLVADFLVFASQVLLGIIIFGLGLWLANFAHKVIMSTAGTNANLLAQAARLAIIVLAAAMGLRQMGVADDIVNLAFGLLLGAIALAIALAFGLGSREIAARETENMLSQLRGGKDK